MGSIFEQFLAQNTRTRGEKRGNKRERKRERRKTRKIKRKEKKTILIQWIQHNTQRRKKP